MHITKYIRFIYSWYSLKNESQAGFTLIEIMVAIAVFSIGILAVAALQTDAVDSTTSANELTQASTLAEEVVEQLSLAKFFDPDHPEIGDRVLQDMDNDGDASQEDANLDGVDDDGGFFGLDDDTIATADHSLISGKYTVLWNVADGVPLPNSENSKTKTIRVIVTWENPNNTRVSVHYVKADKF